MSLIHIYDRVLTEENSAFPHIRAGNVHFHSGHAVLRRKDAGQFSEIFRAGSIDIGNDRHILPGECGQSVSDEGFHPVILKMCIRDRISPSLKVSHRLGVREQPR